jgi:hypothetical protein
MSGSRPDVPTELRSTRRDRQRECIAGAHGAFGRDFSSGFVKIGVVPRVLTVGRRGGMGARRAALRKGATIRTGSSPWLGWCCRRSALAAGYSAAPLRGLIVTGRPPAARLPRHKSGGSCAAATLCEIVAGARFRPPLGIRGRQRATRRLSGARYRAKDATRCRAHHQQSLPRPVICARPAFGEVLAEYRSGPIEIRRVESGDFDPLRRTIGRGEQWACKNEAPDAWDTAGAIANHVADRHGRGRQHATCSNMDQ